MIQHHAFENKEDHDITISFRTVAIVLKPGEKIYIIPKEEIEGGIKASVPLEVRTLEY